MDKAFEKIGIYDFMGIWGSGTIILSYSLFTFLLTHNIDLLNKMKGFQADYSILIIFVFCVIGYISVKL